MAHNLERLCLIFSGMDEQREGTDGEDELRWNNNCIVPSISTTEYGIVEHRRKTHSSLSQSPEEAEEALR